MALLFEYLVSKSNPALTFIDADTKQKKSWGELISSLYTFDETNKKIAFLYTDNSLASINFFFSFLKSPHAVFLLNKELNPKLKEELEAVYSPDFIYDPKRENIGGYSVLFSEDQHLLFQCTFVKKRNIHPDLKILLSTSGTTGSPKFVKLTENNFISNTSSILDYLPIEKIDSCILNLPVCYSYGLSVLLTNIAAGGKIVCTNETVLSRNFWNIFKENNCNSIAGVPYTYEMLVRAGFTKMEGLNIKYMTQAGGKLNEKTLKLFADHAVQQHVRFYVMYGQTEATARMSFLPAEKLQQKIGSIGTPIKNGSFSIDTDTKELIYKGPNIGGGYATNVEDMETCVPQEELHTGDLAEKDDEGYYYISGRIKRFVKLFGNRVSLDEIENDLKKQFDCYIGCCGLNDKTLLIFSDNRTINEVELKNYVSEKYQIHISVIKYIFVQTLPFTSNHKVNYQIGRAHV